MSLELKDLRCKITAEADAVLEAINRATGKDKSEIAREILHKWAIDQIHASTLIDKMLRSEGLSGIAGGIEGKSGES